MKVLIIGGAGFIGSHTADELDKKGYEIIIYDNLNPKTHGSSWPEYLNPKFEKIKADVRDEKSLEQSLIGVDYIINLAAQMDLVPEFSLFSDINITGTARLYELIVRNKLPIKKVVVASSQFVYGEGRYNCPKDGEVFPKNRSNEQLSQGKWNPLCPKCGGEISSLPNLEIHQDPPNQYAITKYTQELMALKLGKLYNIPSAAMRYSIVHGPRQSIKNTYSGALRIFALKMLNNEEPDIYEDGLSQRDFVSVYDVARANVLALEDSRADYENFNVGGGKAYTVLDLANMVNTALNKNFSLKPCGKFRVGDIRHAVSDITKLSNLGWKSMNTEDSIVKEYLEWLKKQEIDFDLLKQTQQNLNSQGVVKSVI